MRCPCCGEYTKGAEGHKLGCTYVELCKEGYEDSDFDMVCSTDYVRGVDDLLKSESRYSFGGDCFDDSSWDSFGSDSDYF